VEREEHEKCGFFLAVPRTTKKFENKQLDKISNTAD
jgi:hypothetical protein